MAFGTAISLGFLFDAPAAALATALFAALVPILIHLINRSRYRVVPWAAMLFLRAAHHQNVRRMQLQQLVLLAVRATIVVLLVLAMASVMPWAEDLIWQHVYPQNRE